MTANKSTGADEVKVNGYAVLIAVLCALTWGVSFISRSVWSSAIASESALTAIGITTLQAGGIATAFYVGYVASNFFSGFLIDAVGARFSLALTAVGTGACTLLIPLCTGYWAMFLLRVLAGVFAGPLFSCLVKFNYAYFPDSLRAVINGVMGIGPAVGNAIASVWFTPMVAQKGYKVAFLCAGAVTLVVGVIVYLVVKDRGVTKPIKNMEVLSEEEKANATKNAVKVFMQKDFLIGVITHFFCMCASTGTVTWMLAYLINGKGYTAATAGLVFGASQIVGLVSGPTSGIVSDLLKTRKWIMITCAPIAAVLLFLFTKINSVGLLTITFVVFQFCVAFAGGNNNVMQAERAKGPYSGKVMGWYNAACQLGSVVMPTVLGAILAKTGNYAAVIYGIAFTYLCVCALGFLVKDTYKKKA